MKNTLKIDFEACKIVMDRTFAQKCTDTRSEEYAQLQAVRRDYPTFSVVTRTIKKNPNKESYKGLTYQYMEDYIFTHESEETVEVALAEFAEMRLIAACHSKAFRYPTIKKWFLQKYPEIAKFGRVATTEETKVMELPTDKPAA